MDISSVCWNYLNGYCPYGDACRHFHPSFPIVPAQLANWVQYPQPVMPIEPENWYTAICKHFKQKRRCPMGEDCRFIHDASVLKFKELNSHASNSARHCWPYVQGQGCTHETCTFSHPADTQPFRKYTPCPRWPSCMPGCEFKHPITAQASFYNHEAQNLSPTQPPTPTAVRIRVTRKDLDPAPSQVGRNNTVNTHTRARARRY
ncbi:hypothetical protein DFS33DRAFT_774491 [Desarmillaria ectypa]|nr:hypothetical protein DFS33DRAFT_774491 [Desarmillaria ectypa]